MQIKTCKYCSTIFYKNVQYSYQQWAKTIYCSRGCASKGRIKLQPKTCLKCQKLFLPSTKVDGLFWFLSMLEKVDIAEQCPLPKGRGLLLRHIKFSHYYPRRNQNHHNACYKISCIHFRQSIFMVYHNQKHL